jgi:hypothetical protein
MSKYSLTVCPYFHSRDHRTQFNDTVPLFQYSSTTLSNLKIQILKPANKINLEGYKSQIHVTEVKKASENG